MSRGPTLDVNQTLRSPLLRPWDQLLLYANRRVLPRSLIVLTLMAKRPLSLYGQRRYTLQLTLPDSEPGEGKHGTRAVGRHS